MKKITLLGFLFAITYTTAFAEGMPIDSDMHQNKDIARADFLKRADKHFSRMDVNADGVLTPDERKAGREKMLEHHRGHKDQRAEKAPPTDQ